MESVKCFSILTHEHRKLKKDGQYKMREHLNDTTWTNHYDWPIKCNHFLLSHPSGVHRVMCKLRFTICKGYLLHPKYCVQAMYKPYTPFPLVGPLLIFTKSANYFPILHEHKKKLKKIWHYKVIDYLSAKTWMNHCCWPFYFLTLCGEHCA